MHSRCVSDTKWNEYVKYMVRHNLIDIVYCNVKKQYVAINDINCVCFLNRAFRYYMRENQQMHQLLFNLLVMYGGSYMFRHYIAILRERS
jgi:hypothetical protein